MPPTFDDHLSPYSLDSCYSWLSSVLVPEQRTIPSDPRRRSVIAVPTLLNVEAGQVEHVAAEFFISGIRHPSIDNVICALPSEERMAATVIGIVFLGLPGGNRPAPRILSGHPERLLQAPGDRVECRRVFESKAGVGPVAADVETEKPAGGELTRDVGPPQPGQRSEPAGGSTRRGVPAGRAAGSASGAGRVIEATNAASSR